MAKLLHAVRKRSAVKTTTSLLYLSVISQIIYQFTAIVPRLQRRWNGFPLQPSGQLDFRRLAVSRRSSATFSIIQTHLICRFYFSPWVSSADAGTSLRRRSLTRLRIFRDRSLDTATSASWKVAYPIGAPHLGSGRATLTARAGERCGRPAHLTIVFGRPVRIDSCPGPVLVPSSGPSAVKVVTPKSS